MSPCRLTVFPFLRNLPHHLLGTVGVDEEDLYSTVTPDLHPQPGLDRREFNVWLAGLGWLDDADNNLGNARMLFRSVYSGDSRFDDGGVAARHFGAFQKTFRRVVGHANPPALPFYGSSVTATGFHDCIPATGQSLAGQNSKVLVVVHNQNEPRLAGKRCRRAVRV